MKNSLNNSIWKNSRLNKRLIIISTILIMFLSLSLNAQNNFNLAIEGSWQEGPSYAVQSNDRYLFANSGCYLKIIDFSDTTNIIEISRILTRGVINDIQIKDSLIFVALIANGLSIINISDIINPIEISHINVYGFHPNIALHNDILYYGCNSTIGIMTVDISDPYNPVLMKSVKTESVYNMSIKDHILYAAARWKGLRLYDISNVDTIIEISSFEYSYTYDLDIKNNILSIATSDSIILLDITIPDNPLMLSSYKEKSCTSIRFIKDMILIGGRETSIIDISNPFSPQLLNSIFFDDQVKDITISDSTIFVSNSAKGVQVLRLTEDKNIHRLSSIECGNYYQSVVIKDNIAFLGSADGIDIIDISDMKNPIYLKNINPGNPITSLQVKDKYLFCSNSGLQIFDITDPINPIEISHFKGSTLTYKFKIINNQVYLSYGTLGLIILDISNKSNPFIVGKIDLPSRSYSVDIKGIHAYVANTDGLQIIDISNPETPIFLNNFNKYKTLRSVSIIDNYAYIGSDNFGIRIIDISDIYNMFSVKYLNTHRGYDLFISDSLAYISGGVKGIIIYNITNIEDPKLIGSHLTPGVVYNIFKKDDKVFIADYDAGMSIYSFDKCAELKINHTEQDIDCYNNCNGYIEITEIENKVGDVHYQWSTGENLSFINNLCKGTYYLTISDENNCSLNDSFFIYEPPELVFESIIKQNITDFNNKGSITLDIFGGTPDYQYSWTGPNNFESNLKNIDNLEVGCYVLNLEDANNCFVQSDSICIEDERSSTVEFDNVSNISIYPNPSKKEINIKFSNLTNDDKLTTKLEIINNAGQTIKLLKAPIPPKIDISELNFGLYFFKFQTNNNTYISKITILK